jgi:hypothetical protein
MQPTKLTKECPMRHIRVLICRVDDPASDQMTDLAAFDLPASGVSALQPESALDELETTTQETSNAILRRTIHAQWDLIDAFLSELCPVAPTRPAPQAHQMRDTSTDARTAHARHAA